MFLTFFLFVGKRINCVKWLRQRKSEARRWDSIRLSREQHIPYVKLYSALAHMGSYGGESFQPFNTNGLTESKTSEHLRYILSVLWEKGRLWESEWETDMEKGKRQKNWAGRVGNDSTHNQKLCSFVLSLCMTHSYLMHNSWTFSMMSFMVTLCQPFLFAHLLIQGEGDTVRPHRLLRSANSLTIHPFSSDPWLSMANMNDNDITSGWDGWERKW